MRDGSGSGAALKALVSVQKRTFHRVTQLQKYDAKILLFFRQISKTTRIKFVFEELPNSSETEGIRKIR